MSQTQEAPRAREKLRQSCNTCASSKVRCSKDQPSCVRCSNRRLYCHYSPSRRTGKRRAASDDPTPITANGLDTTPASGDSRAFEKQARVKHGSIPDTTTQILSDLNLHQLTDDAFFPIHGAPVFPNSDQDPFDYSLPTSSECTDQYVGNSLLDFGALLTPSSFDGVGPLLGGLCSESTSIEPTISGTTVPHAQTCTNQFAEKPRDCMSLAINTLQSLHTAPSTCSLASGSPAKAAFSLDPTIEHVLARNRAILDSVSVILSCYCSLNAQLALVLTLIGSKLIAWYRAVLKNDDPFGDAASSHEGRQRDLDTMAERVLHLPVTVVGTSSMVQTRARCEHSWCSVSSVMLCGW